MKTIVDLNMISSKDFNLLNNNIIIEKEIGLGADGSVRECKDEKGSIFAVKIINNDKDRGITKLTEVSIMTQISHPNLNSALSVFSNKDYLFIFQDLAVSDLHKYIINNNEKISLETRNKWSFSLIQGLHILHLNKIIHGDVKAKNVLLYSDNNIKLTDFSFSIKRTSEKDFFTHRISTWTHMPLESVMKIPWNEKADIWCLGCTLYEIYYNNIIFRYQLEALQDLKDTKLSSEEIKEFYIIYMTINSIADWGINGPIYDMNNIMFCKNIISENAREHLKFNLSDSFSDPQMAGINEMILSCLYVIPITRTNTKTLLKNKLFSGKHLEKYTTIQKNRVPIANSIILNVTKIISDKNIDKHVSQLALILYQLDTEDIEDELKIETCILIASKIYLKPFYFPKKSDLFDTERRICNNLHFRLLDL